MKLAFIVLLTFLSTFAYAAKKFTGLNDIAISKGTGVNHIQFVLGGEGQSISDAKSEAAVVKMFRANIISLYHCYSEIYGNDSHATGQMTVRLEIKDNKAGPIDFDAKGIDSPHFLNCLKDSWVRLELENSISAGRTIAVTMPIQAEVRR